MVKSDDKFNKWLLVENRRIAHQRMLDEWYDYQVYEADLEQAQEPLKPSIRLPAEKDWERIRKYFGYVPARTIQNTYKHTTQHGGITTFFLSPEKIQIS